MDIGTAVTLDDVEEIKPRRSGLSGGPNSGNSGRQDPGGGGGGGDDNRKDDSDQAPPETFIPNKSRILTAFLLLVVLMTFGGLIAAYVVIFTNNVAEWQPFDLPVQVWISTVLIIVSSVTYHLAKTAIDREDQPGAKRWLIVTTVLGASFISSQILAWIALRARGLYMGGNPYAGFFYILTAVHAVHVLGGVSALGAVLLRSWVPTENPFALAKRRTLGQVVGWYWHFMGALWVVLFILLGFWK